MRPGPGTPWLPPPLWNVGIGAQQRQALLAASATEAVEAIAQDRELLQRAVELAHQTAAGTVTPEEAGRQISQDSPEVASLLDRVPEGALRKVVISVLLQVVLFVAGHYADRAVWGPSATADDAERIVAQHDRATRREIKRDERRAIKEAVERAFQEYERQHPPAAEDSGATTPKPEHGP